MFPLNAPIPHRQLSVRNHYVSQLYLKGFTDTAGKVWVHRLLVSSDRVPQWKPFSTSGIGYHFHLYTRMASGQESDEIEEWLSREFEDPAREAIGNVVAEGR